jgi:hypothetical protein
MKIFRHEISFNDQVFLAMDRNFDDLDDVRTLAVRLLDRQGYGCTHTWNVRVEDLPILYHCMNKVAEQLGIQTGIRIAVPRRHYDIYSTFYRCVSEIWQHEGTLDSNEFFIPYSVKNVEVLMAVVGRLVSLREVVVHDNFEDTVRELVPEPLLSRYSLDSDLDAVVLREKVSFRWKNIEVSFVTSRVRQVFKVLDEWIPRVHTTDKFVHVQLTDHSVPSTNTLPMRGNDKEFSMNGGYTKDIKVIFHDYFPHEAAQNIMRSVNVVIGGIMGRGCSRGAVINVGICDDELRVEPPDAIWIPNNRLRGYTGIPTQTLAAAHICQLIDKIRFRR